MADRRTVLRLLGATAAATGLAGTTTAQDDDETETDDGDEDDRLPIVLGGKREYWLGVAPEEIEGEENPTMELEDGQQYEIVWINLDGLEHELVVETEDGEELAASDSSEDAGEAVSTTVDASDEMAEYYCSFHPDSMRGDVETNGGFDLSGDGSDDGNDSDDGDGSDDSDDHDSNDHGSDDGGDY